MLDSSRDWLFNHPELSRNEALLLCEIMRWPNGCHKSSKRLANDLKFHPRTVQRLVKTLAHKQWVAVLYDKTQFRLIYATPKEPPTGPLFQYKQKAQQAIQRHQQKQSEELILDLAEKWKGQK